MMKLPTPPWLSALAYELEAARDAATSNMLAVVRPWLEVEYRNRHFYATEAMEGIVMQLFLLEVRKRCFAPLPSSAPVSLLTLIGVRYHELVKLCDGCFLILNQNYIRY